MLAFLNTRRGLATGAAVVIGCILLFLVTTSETWRPLIGNGAAPSLSSATPMGRVGDHLPAASPGMMQPNGAASTEAEPGQTTAPSSQTAALPSDTTSQGPGSQVTTTDTARGSLLPSGSGGDAADHGTPTFDIVRIEPTGDSVIAARGLANADVVLLDSGVPIARAKTDGNGQVALLPPPLTSGDHSLMLSMAVPGQTATVSSQSIVVSVPDKAKTAPLVAMIQPNQPAAILSGPVAGSTAAATGTKQAGAPDAPMAIRSVEVEDMGSFYATGKGTPGKPCRIYLNGAFVATVTPDGSGVWSLQIKRGMKPGRYAVRVDQVEAKTGAVVARAEVPFDYPRFANVSLRKGLKASRDGKDVARTTADPQAISGSTTSAQSGASVESGAIASAGAPLAVPAKRSRVASNDEVSPATSNGTAQGKGSSVVLSDLVTAKVFHGDSLWRISRKMLGHGIRYTQIYAANVLQIRDPRLIYPGQVFVMPQAE